MSLHERHGVDKPWSFNRKEAKDHGEGGLIVGRSRESTLLCTLESTPRELVRVLDEGTREYPMSTPAYKYPLDSRESATLVRTLRVSTRSTG